MLAVSWARQSHRTLVLPRGRMSSPDGEHFTRISKLLDLACVGAYVPVVELEEWMQVRRTSQTSVYFHPSNFHSFHSFFGPMFLVDTPQESGYSSQGSRGLLSAL